MKNISLKLSNDLDDIHLSLYRLIAKIFDKIKLPYLIVGARARDLILAGVYGIKCPRATLDTDLGIMLKTWEEFFQVKNQFIQLADFEIIAGVNHRIISPTYGILDFIPFGPISTNDQITWPEEYASVMNILGFQDAYECSIFVDIDEETSIRCCSLAGLSILKLIALADRKFLTKDADDLALIMMSYPKAGQSERIFDEFSDFIKEDFDYDSVSMRLLGRDIFQSASASCQNRLLEILEEEIQFKNHPLLATALSKLNLSFDDNFGRAIDLLKSMKMEFQQALSN